MTGGTGCVLLTYMYVQHACQASHDKVTHSCLINISKQTFLALVVLALHGRTLFLLRSGLVHWRKLVKNIGWANQNIGEQRW